MTSAISISPFGFGNLQSTYSYFIHMIKGKGHGLIIVDDDDDNDDDDEEE